MVSITAYGGINEIGGNKLLIEDKKSRIFLDFGQSFNLLDNYFVPEAFLSPRARFGLRDYFAFNLIPKLRGLYSKDILEKTDLAYAEPEFDGVILSHAHFDHVAHLQYLHPDIPLYLGEATELILRSTQETTNQKFFKEETKTNTFRTGKDFSVGDFKVCPVHVDHSVPGAYGFVIETSEGNIAYSGDLRKHGPRSDMTGDFVKKAGEFDPKVLIIEGTRVAQKENRKNHTEPFVQSESKKVVHESKGLVLAMRYPKDIDRFRTFYSIAKETGRELIISMKMAHLLLSLKDDPIGLPDPYSDKHIKIYGREMKIYKSWEQSMLPKCVDSGYVSENCNNCVLELDFFQLTELIDIKPQGGACIHSMSEPFEEDPISQVSDEVLHNWTETFGLSYHQLHASGHAAMSEIFGFIDEIEPRKVLPIHTQHAELFKGELLRPKKGNKVEM